ncbi:Elongin-A2 [Plecturocebus cupreus]
MAAASTTLHAVEKLQVRLATKTDPKKLGKYLHKLSALPMTADILAETGIRKTVKSLRKHQDVGHFARDLAARWKKPLLVNPNTRPGPDPQDREESSSRAPGRLFRTKKTPGASQKMRRSPGVDLTALSTDGQHTQHLRAPETSAKLPQSPGRNREKAPQNCPRAWSPSSKPEEARLTLLGAGLCSLEAARANPRPKRLGATARGTNPPARGNVAWMSRAVGSPPLPAGRHPPGPAPEGKPQGHPPGKAPGTDRPLLALGHRRKEGATAAVAWDSPPGRWLQTATRRGLGADTHTGRGRVWTARTHARGHTACPPGSNSSFPATQRLKSGSHRPLLWDATSVGPSPEVEEGEEAEELEQPTLSFEQYLAYDQVQKKEKKTVKSSGTARGDQQRRTNRSKGTRESRASPLKLPPVKESHSERLREAGADSSGRETVLGQGFSELWDLSEPWMQANYDLLSAFESMTSQPQTKRHVPHRRSRTETGASGGRVNAKMQVYSGSRPARQPQGLTLRQQCVRALRDNPDVLGQVGTRPLLGSSPCPGRVYA